MAKTKKTEPVTETVNVEERKSPVAASEAAAETEAALDRLRKKHPAATPGDLSEDELVMADLIREALGVLGLDAKPLAVANYIDEKYPLFDYNKSSLQTSMYSIRGKMRKAAGESGAIDTRQPAAEQNGPVTSDNLKTARRLANQFGGIDEFRELVVEVEKAAGQVGGLLKLKRCLDDLKELIG